MHVAFLSQPRDIVVGRGSEVGSVTIVLRSLAQRLAQSAAVTVVSPAGMGLPLQETTDQGLRILRIKKAYRVWHRAIDAVQGLTGFGDPHFTSAGYFREYVNEAAKRLAGDPPDILNIMSYPQFAAFLQPVLPKTQLVLHLHDTALLHLAPEEMRPRLARFDAIVTCSDWLCRELRRHYPALAGRIHAVPNGVDGGEFSPSIPPRKKSSVRLLFVGRVSPEKGVHVLVDAFARIAPSWPNLVLDIAGPSGLLPYSLFRLIAHNGPMRGAAAFYGAHILSRIDREVIRGRASYRSALLAQLPLELRQRVHFVGSVAHDALASLYQSADLLVAPSICSEAFGLPIAEAMACGLPIVATTSGGIQDTVIDGVTGRLVPPGDTTALAKAVEQLLADPLLRRRMGDAGRERVTRTFSWDHSVEHLRTVYLGLRPTRNN